MDTVTNRDGTTLIRIPAGDFLMGTTDEEAAAMIRQYGWRPDRFHDERPQHRVYLDDYQIGQFPVTVAQYRRYIDETGAPTPDCWDDARFDAPEQPVIGVFRSEAKAYCAWAGLRLPTEAEWEKAARGTDARRWPWGNDWYPKRVNGRGSGRGYPAPVAQSAEAGNVSPYGVCDAVGNVWEWCLDRYDMQDDADSPEINPVCTEPEIHYDGYYVMRGGSWIDGPDRTRCASRFDRFDQMRRRHVGFRCAR